MRGNIWRLNSQLAALLSLTSTNTYTEQTLEGNPEFILVSWTQPAVTTHPLRTNIYRPSVILFTGGKVLSRGVSSLAGDLSSTPPPGWQRMTPPPITANKRAACILLECFLVIVWYFIFRRQSIARSTAVETDNLEDRNQGVKLKT